MTAVQPCKGRRHTGRTDGLTPGNDFGSTARPHEPTERRALPPIECSVCPVAPRITRITVPTPFRIGPVNCWLIEGDSLALVDVGPNDPPSLMSLEASLGDLGFRIADLDLLLLTHQHYDHTGLAAELRERSGARVVAHEDLVPFLAGGDASNGAEDEFAEAIMRIHGVDEPAIRHLREGAQRRWRLGCSCPVDTVVRDGDLVDLGGSAVRVHHRPGHSPTDTIFVDEETRTAFVGDHLLGRISSNPILHRPVRGPVDPARRPRTLVRYLESMQRTAGLGLARALTGHGKPVDDPGRLVEARRVDHAQRKERIYAIMEPGPLTAFEIAGVLWPRLPADQVYLGICEVLGHIDLLADEGRVVEVEADGLVRLVRA